MKYLLVFCRCCFWYRNVWNFAFASEDFSCWMPTPHFAKLYGRRQIQDIHWTKDFFLQIFILNYSVFCNFSFFAKDRKTWCTLPTRGGRQVIFSRQILTADFERVSLFGHRSGQPCSQALSSLPPLVVGLFSNDKGGRGERPWERGCGAAYKNTKRLFSPSNWVYL